MAVRGLACLWCLLAAAVPMCSRWCACVGGHRGLAVVYTCPTVYPRMFSLHDLPAEAGSNAEQRLDGATGAVTRVILPPTQWPSAEKFTLDGVYLLSTACAMFMYVPRHLHPVPRTYPLAKWLGSRVCVVCGLSQLRRGEVPCGGVGQAVRRRLSG